MIYHRPENLAECQTLFAEIPVSERRVLAGGTDLMVRLESARSFPPHLVDIKEIPELQGIELGENELSLGALTTLEEIRQSEPIRTEYRALHEAACQFAGLQIRNRATLGGNLVNASPAGDCLPPLYAFDACLTLLSPGGSRQIPIREFITGPGSTTLGKDELLVRIQIPRTGLDSTFFKLGLRDSMAITVVSLATVYAQADGRFTSLRMAAGAVSPTVVYLERLASHILKSGRPGAEDFHLIDGEIQPIDDIRARADYRSKVLKRICRAQLEDILSGGEIHTR